MIKLLSFIKMFVISGRDGAVRLKRLSADMSAKLDKTDVCRLVNGLKVS